MTCRAAVRTTETNLDGRDKPTIDEKTLREGRAHQAVQTRLPAEKLTQQLPSQLTA